MGSWTTIENITPETTIKELATKAKEIIWNLSKKYREIAEGW
jgi:hypothetical protein